MGYIVLSVMIAVTLLTGRASRRPMWARTPPG